MNEKIGKLIKEMKTRKKNQDSGNNTVGWSDIKLSQITITES